MTVHFLLKWTKFSWWYECKTITVDITALLDTLLSGCQIEEIREGKLYGQRFAIKNIMVLKLLSLLRHVIERLIKLRSLYYSG